MANKFPTFNDDEPIFTPVNVNSEAEGYDAFARTLGGIAKTTAGMAEQIEKDKSKTMFINSLADAEEVKTSAQQQLIEHPDQAELIAKNTNYTLDSIKTNAYVNDQDRKLLNYHLRNASNQIGLKATEIDAKQKLLTARNVHFSNWKNQLTVYFNDLKTHPQDAEKIEKAMLASLDGLLKTNVLTIQQYNNSLKDMNAVSQVVHDYQRTYGNPDATAKDYHTVSGHPLNDDKANPNAPINESTMWLQAHNDADKTLQGMLADVSQGRLPDQEAFISANESNRQHVMLAIDGVKDANGLINSGTPVPQIRQTLADLNTKGITLSYRDQAKRDYLDQWLTRLDHGELLSVMGQTPSGNAIFQEHNMQMAALQSSPLSPLQKAQKFIFLKNKLMDQADSWRIANHIHDNLAYIAPKADVNAIEENFKAGGDPKVIMQIASTYYKSHYGALAQSMKTPEQNIAMQGMLFSSNLIPTQEKLDFLSAQQTGLKYPAETVEKGTTNEYLRTQIYSNLQKPLQLIWQNYDAPTAKIMQDAMVQTTLNYARYLGEKDINPGLKGHGGFIFSDIDAKGYVAKASKIYLDAFQQRSGMNWIVSNNQLPANLSDGELDALAAYIVDKGESYLKAGKEPYEYESAISRNPLKMIITPTGSVKAVDGNGQTYYSQPFTSSLMAKAIKESKTRIEAQRKRALNQANERMQRDLLHVRLPDDANNETR